MSQSALKLPKVVLFSFKITFIQNMHITSNASFIKTLTLCIQQNILIQTPLTIFSHYTNGVRSWFLCLPLDQWGAPGRGSATVNRGSFSLILFMLCCPRF